MTHQVSDSLEYGTNSKYSLLGLSEDKIAEYLLQYYGFKNAGSSSACERGCFGHYSIENHYLYLKELSVCNPSRPCPEIGSVVPEFEYDIVSYQNLHEKLSFSGELVIGSPFIANIHMPYVWDFKSVFRVVFVEGYLESVTNLSEDAARLRAKVIEIQRNKKGISTQRQRNRWEKDLRKLEIEAWDLVRGLSEE
jgi:hypothetical protein